MAQGQQTTKKTQTTVAQNKSSYSAVIERLNGIMGQYAGLPMENIYGAFSRAMGGYWANNPIIGNQRVKALNPLPCDYSKQDLNFFLQNPASNERGLRQVAEGLRYTNYSWAKLIKSYSDMLQFHTLTLPQFAENDEIKSDNFKREAKLVEKFIKRLNAKEVGRKIAAQALTQGKVFYYPRYIVDKSHNRVATVFLQQLPSEYVIIEGLNNISNYTLSFNLNYFLQMGTDYRQFGDLFEPFMADFNAWITTPESERKISKRGEKFVYATKNNEKIEGVRKMWEQNGTYMYFVSLPIDKVWTFEINGQDAIVASPLSGLMQTFAQQADYEAAQLSLILNPLIKIFTGEIPYTKAENSTQEDAFRLSLGGRALFEAYWDNLMSAHNTGGTAFFSAPVENLRSHDFPESANANSVSQSFLNYGITKSGAQGVIPITDRPTEEAVKASEKLEAQFAQNIYRTFEKMLNYIFNDELNLSYSWKVHIFGDIYSDEQVRADCLKLIDKGSTYAYLKLGALDDISLLDMVTMTDWVNSSGLLSKLSVPPTSFTQSGKSQPKSDTGGAPNKDQTQVEETKIEKQVEVTEE